VWQIIEFQEAAQVFRAQRTSVHSETLLFPLHAILITPTLQFLNEVLQAMDPSKPLTVTSFPIPDKIIVPSAPTVNVATRSMEFEFQLRHFGVSFKGRLTVPMPEREGAQTISTTGENTDSSRHVRDVPAGTHHWYLCDDTMLTGSRSEELV
jgi:hypothetical protein